MSDRTIDRRQWLTGAATAAGASLLPRRWAPGSVHGANDRILLGIIGSGGRGRNLMKMFLDQSEAPVDFVEVCDVYEPYRNQGLEIAGKRAKGRVDHRKLLENDDLDAVIIATPDHWHLPQLKDALDAGLDVYLEKPMSLSIDEGRRMVEMVRATDRVVQIGMQRRSAPGVIEARELVRSGALGAVNFAHAQWFWNMDPIPEERPLKGDLDWERFRGPNSDLELDVPRHARFFNWRYFWDFSGGNMTDQGTHLMDVIQWFLNDGEPPRSAVCSGNVYRLEPAETPDVFTAVFEYPGFLATWTLVYTNSYEDSWRVELQGNEATMVLDKRGYRVYPDPGRGGDPQPPSTEVRAGLTATAPHIQDFLKCVHDRSEPNAPVEVGHKAVTGPHLANVALRRDAKALLNAKGEVELANREASRP